MLQSLPCPHPHRAIFTSYPTVPLRPGLGLVTSFLKPSELHPTPSPTRKIEKKNPRKTLSLFGP